MKIVIFAGGTGRRLWPLSRQASPKQFEPIIGERSTLQLAVDRARIDVERTQHELQRLEGKPLAARASGFIRTQWASTALTRSAMRRIMRSVTTPP